MPDLLAVLEGTGCQSVRTYVQSGNAVVEHRGSTAELELTVAAALADRGLSVPVMVRTGEQLAQVVAASPWSDLDPQHFHVAFLSGQPEPSTVAAIDHQALLPERVVVGERVLYLDYAMGVGRSRGLDRLRLGVDATARNWRTVRALLELATWVANFSGAAAVGRLRKRVRDVRAWLAQPALPRLTRDTFAR